MILRFCSGSVTPASAPRNRSCSRAVDEVQPEVVAEGRLDLGALVVTHQPVVDEHARELVADGLVHERGRDRAVDAAREPAQDGPVADLLADALDELLDDVVRGPLGVQARAVVEEPAQHLLPVGGVADLGVVLDAVEPPVRVLDDRARGGVGGRDDAEAGGRLDDGVPVRHPHGLAGGLAGEDGALGGRGELGLAVLGDAALGHPAAEGVGEELLAVADPQHRDAELEDVRVEAGGALGVHALGSAREDDRAGRAVADLAGGDRVGHDLGVDVGLAHATGDELRVLGAEVDDEHGVEGLGHGVVSCRASSGQVLAARGREATGGGPQPGHPGGAARASRPHPGRVAAAARRTATTTSTPRW